MGTIAIFFLAAIFWVSNQQLGISVKGNSSKPNATRDLSSDATILSSVDNRNRSPGVQRAQWDRLKDQLVLEGVIIIQGKSAQAVLSVEGKTNIYSLGQIIKEKARIVRIEPNSVFIETENGGTNRIKISGKQIASHNVDKEIPNNGQNEKGVLQVSAAVVDPLAQETSEILNQSGNGQIVTFEGQYLQYENGILRKDGINSTEPALTGQK